MIQSPLPLCIANKSTNPNNSICKRYIVTLFPSFCLYCFNPGPYLRHLCFACSDSCLNVLHAPKLAPLMVVRVVFKKLYQILSLLCMKSSTSLIALKQFQIPYLGLQGCCLTRLFTCLSDFVFILHHCTPATLAYFSFLNPFNLFQPLCWVFLFPWNSPSTPLSSQG